VNTSARRTKVKPNTVRSIREGLDLPRDRFAELVGVETRTVYRWESGDSAIAIDSTVARVLVLLGAATSVKRKSVRASFDVGGWLLAWKDLLGS
jgi:DNA-binding XRE family transcriptional regulator